MPTTPECRSCGLAASRREFVAKTLLAAVGVWYLQACGDGEVGGPGAPRVPPPITGDKLTVSIADFPALSTIGGIARVDDDNDVTPVAAVRTGAETFLAFSMVCPHQGFSPINIVALGFHCPNHGAEFNSSGQWTGGQVTGGLLAYPTSFDVSTGTLTIG